MPRVVEVYTHKNHLFESKQYDEAGKSHDCYARPSTTVGALRLWGVEEKLTQITGQVPDFSGSSCKSAVQRSLRDQLLGNVCQLRLLIISWPARECAGDEGVEGPRTHSDGKTNGRGGSAGLR